MANRYNSIIIKTLLVTIFLSLTGSTSFSQYYYKDLVTTGQINETFRLYKSAKVNTVKLNSFQGNEPVTEGFECEQKVNLARNEVVTYTKTADIGETYFTAFYNQHGLLVKTIDSMQESVSTSYYQYDANHKLSRLDHETRAIDNSSKTTETHVWDYSADGKPQKMTRIKNRSDSTLIKLTIDEKGNVVEEEGVRNGVSLGKVYYYYDEKNRLTDVVRYNVKAKRLLPDYMFEYEETGELSSMTVVPEGSNDYQKWYYTYNESGLKAVEFCFNKKNELLGKVEYSYIFGR